MPTWPPMGSSEEVAMLSSARVSSTQVAVRVMKTHRTGLHDFVERRLERR
jgi:hypothetical protein